MKTIKTQSLTRLVITCVFAFLYSGAGAQDPAKPYKREVKSYSDKYGNTGDNAYWVDKDTVYNCQLYTGSKIALADIDFSKKQIVKSEMLVDGTKDNVYVIVLTLVKGKWSYAYGCVLGDLAGAERRTTNSIKLAEKGEAMAELEFTVLHRMALERKIAANGDNNSTADTSTGVVNDNRSAIDKILDEHKNDPDSKTTGDVPVPTGPSAADEGDFDAQLLALINGLKDDFRSIKGALLKSGQNESTVKLAGAENTHIVYGMFGHPSLVVDFGNFSKVDDALSVYRKFVDKVENVKNMPASMVKQQEQIIDSYHTTVWIPFGDVDEGLKGFTLMLELGQSAKFDKDFNKTDIFFVQLKIDK